MALRDERKTKSLAIENKRRSAKGLPLLDDIYTGNEPTIAAVEGQPSPDAGGSAQTGVDGASVGSSGSPDASAQADENAAGNKGELDDEGQEEVDVLLLEAGNILVDAVTARSEMVASNERR